MNAIVIGIIGYIGLQILIGVWVARRVTTEADYMLAGRSLGVGLAATSIFATWFGAEVVIGAASRVYSNGISGAHAEPFAYAAGILIMGLVFAHKLWRHGIQTFARFLPRALLGQGRAAGGGAADPGLGTVGGGADPRLRPDRRLGVGPRSRDGADDRGGRGDRLHGPRRPSRRRLYGFHPVDRRRRRSRRIAWIAVAEVGGISAGLAKIDSGRFQFFPEGQSLLALAEKWAIPICGSIVAVELISRLLACRTPNIARTSATLGGIAYLLIALIPVTIGLIGPLLVPIIADPEQLVPEIAKAHLPPILYVLFVGALISAILSTVDSALLAAGTMLSHNLLLRLLPAATERTKVRIARASVAALGLCAYVLALRTTHISDLVETASAFASAGLFVTLVFGLFTRLGGELSAIAAMMSGALVWLVGSSVLGLEAPYLAGLAAAVVAYVAVAQFEAQSPIREAV